MFRVLTFLYLLQGSFAKPHKALLKMPKSLVSFKVITQLYAKENPELLQRIERIFSNKTKIDLLSYELEDLFLIKGYKVQVELISDKSLTDARFTFCIENNQEFTVEVKKPYDLKHALLYMLVRSDLGDNFSDDFRRIFNEKRIFEMQSIMNSLCDQKVFEEDLCGGNYNNGPTNIGLWYLSQALSHLINSSALVHCLFYEFPKNPFIPTFVFGEMYIRVPKNFSLNKNTNYTNYISFSELENEFQTHLARAQYNHHSGE